MKQWIQDYITAQKAALDSIPADAVQRIIEQLRRSWKEDRLPEGVSDVYAAACG